MAERGVLKKGAVLKGSVKNILVKKAPTENETGLGVFTFTDDYSVFDYGKMPDTIPSKGEAMCRMAAYNFEQLAKLGIRSHFLKQPAPGKMEVSLVRVLYPQKGELKKGMANFLVPLEVIFRNSLPEGSSVFKRLRNGQIRPEDLGLSKTPEPGAKLERPIIDFSTKLEPTDRYLSRKEALQISALSEKEFGELAEKALKINEFITERAELLGLEHADGKVEFGLSPKRELLLVDVCGTLDENRFLCNGVHLSKQILRDYYKATPWPKALADAMEQSEDRASWPAPEPLPDELIEIVSNLYKSACEAWTEKKVWGAPKIGAVLQEYQDFLDRGE